LIGSVLVGKSGVGNFGGIDGVVRVFGGGLWAAVVVEEESEVLVFQRHGWGSETEVAQSWW